jgi:hypothetical protein
MVSHDTAKPARRAGAASIPWAHSPLEDTPHNAEDFKQGAMYEKVADARVVDGTLLKIPLC